MHDKINRIFSFECYCNYKNASLGPFKIYTKPLKGASMLGRKMGNGMVRRHVYDVCRYLSWLSVYEGKHVSTCPLLTGRGALGDKHCKQAVLLCFQDRTKKLLRGPLLRSSGHAFIRIGSASLSIPLSLYITISPFSPQIGLSLPYQVTLSFCLSLLSIFISVAISQRFLQCSSSDQMVPLLL